MRVDTDDLRVAKLIGAWRDFPSLSEDVLAQESRAFRKALVREIIQPSVAEHSGELVLFYHKFLTRVPSGIHSFAHGSEMMSQDVYWVTVARIKSDMFLSLVETEEKPFTIGRDRAKISVALSPRFFIPVEWKICLKSRYSNNSHAPHFVTDDSADKKHSSNPVADRESERLDVSAFGNHLFRFGRRFQDDLSWATNIFLVFGDTSVKAWLTEVGSPPDVYEKLEHWQADSADTQAPPPE